MPVPDYQTLMAPVLAALADGAPQRSAVVRDSVAARLGLTEADRRETIPSGPPLFDNRANWALTYLCQAGLVARPRRGVVQLTPRGRGVLVDHPDRVDNTVLGEFEEFAEFRRRSRSRRGTSDGGEGDGDDGGRPNTTLSAVPPVETVARAVDEANAAVAEDLLARVRAADPAFLERLVLRVLTVMGYGGSRGAAERLGRVGDEGLDGVIRQDALGLDRIYIQAKRYAADRPVGRPDIQAFVGALQGAQADRGIYLTTSRFTDEAVAYADRVQAQVVLVDGAALARHMLELGIGVQVDATFVIKRVDEDFFDPV